MKKLWSDKAWEEYCYWQLKDKKILKKINEIIKDIERNGVDNGISKPEKLKYREGWSRRIDKENRRVYDIVDNMLLIISYKGHYEN